MAKRSVREMIASLYRPGLAAPRARAARLSGSEARRAFITDLYAGMLGRAPDPSGLSYYLARLGSRPRFRDASQMVRAFVSSKEAQAQREADIWGWRASEPADQEPVRAILSLGTHCLTSHVLKTFGLKRFSGPFDWIFSSMPMAAHCIEDDFRTFLDQHHHEQIPQKDRVVPDANFCEHRFYRDHYGVKTIFNHYDVTLPEHHAYYVRCVERFRQSLRADQRTLLVMLTPEHQVGKGDFDRLCNALAPYPKAELLVVRTCKRAGKFGGELVQRQGRHQFHNLNLIGKLGTLSFVHQGDEAMFRLMLHHYKFDLSPLTA
ncbi:MAG TPA: DUF1796 family putative cysteine peptidase [Sphingobium sp.]|nr:DUF1796 family putative cysteine peptidase [Sphingobium sp.]